MTIDLTDQAWTPGIRTNGLALLLGLCLLSANDTSAQLDFEGEPINYHTSAVTDRVASLQERLDKGEASLAYDGQHGYLRSVLERLEVPISSQMLVFSKTSFQLRRITPWRPRAVYFNDDVYIGWVQGGDVVEVSSVDPQQGAIFYTLKQEPSDGPKFVRDRGQCIVCHASSRTAGVPGHLVRSVYADGSGQPLFGAGTFTTDHRSPFKRRWGGWYVTGTHGSQRHMGNVVVTNRASPETLDRESGANLTDLQERVNLAPYLGRHSDIVALLVLEHQTRMHNLITRASFEARAALHYDQIMNEAMDRPLDFRSESTQRRIESAGDQLADYMLFCDETTLKAPVEGTSGFEDQFAALGPYDSQGRSLREFDLSHRLMKYPCSYLIYSASFDRLPDSVKKHVYQRLFDVLSGDILDGDILDGDILDGDILDGDILDGTVQSDDYDHLSASDRRAILEILRDTKSGLPDYWMTET